MENVLVNIIDVLIKALSIYYYILIIRVILTWFPNLDWSNPILSNISAITDPYLNLFRGIIPMIGGLDISPILAFIVLQVLQSSLSKIIPLTYNFVY